MTNAIHDDTFNKRSMTEKYTFNIPKDVKRELSQLAIERKTTVKVLILEAINHCLVRVRPIDLQDHRGIFMKRFMEVLARQKPAPTPRRRS